MNATPPLPPVPPAAPPPATGMAAWGAGLRFLLGARTAVPRGWGPADAETVARGMRLAPLVGLGLGALAGGLCWTLLALEAGWLLTGVLTVALLALLTRGLSLAGLAGLADALASRLPAAEARALAGGSWLGRAGSVALLFAVLTQVAAVHELAGHGRDYAAGAVLAAVLVGWTAVSWAGREVPPAEPGGPDAALARSVPVSVAVPLAAVTALLAGGLGGLTAGEPGAGAVIGVSAVVLGLGAAELVLWQARERLGGLTEGVLGAVGETATAVALVTLVVGAT
ncbi:adenosylcobinamide-GDP ribazoletransferase [Streptomyces sp. DSM 44915]|uniref:Adenosylcobinamide-GDP ribazoletransferase n=1 Tax=Streptomyces chisholmiae TaxID=3075540 RepID=A0ABU2JJG7_9ACTN|nr:adenosylcobinamide-GDP ribazoletransferase [Streptomyces sp. DSM 44915]MDT0264906.1 adenosylcobinamide-GDP ribazoletransferase [Streptomyces sp. DSM 44915]